VSVQVEPRSAIERLQSAFAVRISLKQLSLFAGNLATCLGAGLALPVSLETSHRSCQNRTMRRIATSAAERVREGMELSDALEADARHFPPFFLPVLRCGERSGRVPETLRYLERHCRLMAGPHRMMRNLWLAPLAITLAGSAVGMAAHFCFAPVGVAVAFAARTLWGYVKLLAVIGLVYFAPPVKRLLDRLMLALPWISTIVRDLSVNRFFHAMNMLYSTGGIRVEAMIRQAAACVDNHVARADFLRAAEVIESGGTIAAAFAVPVLIPREYKSEVAVGEEAGKLEQAFDTVARRTAKDVEFRVKIVSRILFRVVMALVVFSMVGVLQSLIFSFAMR
jgi:type II secretory pathway component PulF